MKALIGLIVTMISVSAFAYTREGNFNYQGHSYYSNGVGAYCEKQYDYQFPTLSQYDARELRNTNFQGMCDVGYARGPFNYRGVSYYANSQGAYCRFSYYNRALSEVSSREAQAVFAGRYDGICQN